MQYQYQMMLVSVNNNTTEVRCRTGIANPSGAPEFTTEF